MTIADNVDFILKQKKMTKRALAKALGITPQNLYIILSGNTTLRNIEKIAKALGTKPSEIVADPPLSKQKHFHELNGPQTATITCPVCGSALNITLSE